MIDNRTLGFRYAERLHTEVLFELKTRGFRKNLGYDLQPKLETYLDSLNISHTDRWEIIKSFIADIDNLIFASV